MNKAKIINETIKNLDAKTYLEIGYQDGHNFNQVECETKVGVDPELKENHIEDNKILFKGTSDEFFESETIILDEVDVVFIDGLHHADQVRKDIINSLKLKPKTIILHDTIPPSKEAQMVPRAQKIWTGDVWRAVVGFRNAYPDVKLYTKRADYGLTFIEPDGKKARKKFEDMEMTYEHFVDNQVELLNIQG